MKHGCYVVKDGFDFSFEITLKPIPGIILMSIFSWCAVISFTTKFLFLVLELIINMGKDKVNPRID